jgi:MFS transporter, NNP family, nitrate/nitrite transporter
MFGVLGVPIRKELGLSDVQLSWLVAIAILNGSLWRLPAGLAAERWGGRVVFTFFLLSTAVFSFLVAHAHSYGTLLVLAALVGLAGNAFTAGIAWNSAWFPREQGFALGLFGAGNVGASVTKFLGPALIGATAGSTYLGFVEGGWRLIPVIYAVLLVITAIALWVVVPAHDRSPGRGRPLLEQLRPLREVRVWRFSLYYVAVFGAYVALAAWLPKYYVDTFGVSLSTGALLTATFIFPASLLRPVGGMLSDRIGARRVMYWTLGTMLVSSGLLMMPNGHIVIQVDSATGTAEVLPFRMTLWLFVVTVFVLGCAMGVGKAAVTSRSTSPATSAPSAGSSACLAAWAGSSSRRCSPTSPGGPACRRRPSSSCSSSPPRASCGCTPPSSRSCSTSPRASPATSSIPGARSGGSAAAWSPPVATPWRRTDEHHDAPSAEPDGPAGRRPRP